MRFKIALIGLAFFASHAGAESTITINGKTITTNSSNITILNGKVITDGEDGDNGIIEGSGKLASEERDLKAFDALSLNVAAQVVVRSGAETTLKITADDNILPIISTKSRGGTLHIDTDRGFSTSNEIRIEIEIPRLTQAEVNGSGSIDIRDVTQDDVDLTINGSGDIRAKGQASELSATINGSGRLLAEDLETEEASVTLSGSGSADIHATQRVRAEVMGSGTVSYSGEPEEVRPSVLGSGSIDRK